MHFVMSPSGIPENRIVLVARGGRMDPTLKRVNRCACLGGRSPSDPAALGGGGVRCAFFSHPALQQIKGGLKLSLGS